MTKPVVAVVGDSFTAGWTNSNPVTIGTPWYSFAAADLGWQVGNVVANPGAGYLKAGDYGTIGQALSAHPIPAATDFVLLQAGLNDTGLVAANIPAAMAAVLATLQQQAPNAVPIVLGMLVPGGQSMSLNRLTIARKMGDYAAIGDTRYSIACMWTFDTGPDGTHPTQSGHQQIGDNVAWHLAHNLGGNGDPLHLDPTGTFYTV